MLAFGRLRQRIVLKCLPHVQHDYFSSFNQSDHCFLASSLLLTSSLLKFPNGQSQRNLRACITFHEKKNSWFDETKRNILQKRNSSSDDSVHQNGRYLISLFSERNMAAMTSSANEQFTTCTNPTMHLLNPSKMCISIVFYFPWDIFMSQENLQTMIMQNFGGVKEVYYVIVQVVNEHSG